MHKYGKRYREQAAKIDMAKSYTVREAVGLARGTSYAKFNATVEVHMRLGVDPKHADQNVRDVVVLPHGLGKVTRQQVREIAEIKMKDLNALDLDGAMKQVEGTARNMGITVEG